MVITMLKIIIKSFGKKVYTKNKRLLIIEEVILLLVLDSNPKTDTEHLILVLLICISFVYLLLLRIGHKIQTWKFCWLQRNLKAN